MEVDCILKNNVVINCNWSVNSGCGDLKNTIKFSSDLSYDLEDIVKVESCVHLCYDNSDRVPCNIHVKLDSKSQFTICRVDIVSEARVIECYGTSEEYLDTIHGEYMDDFEGCTVYSISSMLPSTREISLKFARARHEKEMWLYGVLFTVEKITSPPLKVAGINLSNVNNMLKDSSCPISETAEHCKRLLQQCGNSIDSNGALDPHILQKMFEDERLGEPSKSMSKCLMTLIPFVMKRNEQTLSNDSCNLADAVNSISDPANSVSDSSVPSINNHKNINNNCHIINGDHGEDYAKGMKAYIDKRINDMEEKLTKQIEQRLRDIEISQNDKLDAIMKLLLERK